MNKLFIQCDLPALESQPIPQVPFSFLPAWRMFPIVSRDHHVMLNWCQTRSTLGWHWKIPTKMNPPMSVSVFFGFPMTWEVSWIPDTKNHMICLKKMWSFLKRRTLRSSKWLVNGKKPRVFRVAILWSHWTWWEMHNVFLLFCNMQKMYRTVGEKRMGKCKNVYTVIYSYVLTYTIICWFPKIGVPPVIIHVHRKFPYVT